MVRTWRCPFEQATATTGVFDSVVPKGLTIDTLGQSWPRAFITDCAICSIVAAELLVIAKDSTKAAVSTVLVMKATSVRKAPEQAEA
jgi:hypothetical protein